MYASRQDIRSLRSMCNGSDFASAKKTGIKWVSKGLILIANPISHTSPISQSFLSNNNSLANVESVSKENSLTSENIRVGFIVTKKLAKSAVTRNRIKRRLRSVARDVLPGEAQENTDYILIGRHETLTRPYEYLLEDLRWCLRKIDFIK